MLMLVFAPKHRKRNNPRRRKFASLTKGRGQGL